MNLEVNNELINLAQNLRRNATKEEKILWRKFLSTYPAKFRRQQIVGNYIVDFYCHDAKLAVELDGSQHYEELTQIADAERSASINKLGIEVVRFPNNEVMQKFPSVCQEIDKRVKERMKMNL